MTNKLFTKQTVLMLLLLSTTVVLSGCGEAGVFHDYFVHPFSFLIVKLATFFGGSYGYAIIAITLGVRFILLPLVIKQTRSNKTMQQKMKVLKPEMDEVMAKYKGDKTPESQMAMQKELSALYQKHGTSPFAAVSGCLPLLIQMPIFIALFYAIRQTPEIATHSFLWFELGSRDTPLAVITIMMYFIQARISLINVAPEQQKQMKMLMYITPIMMGMIAFTAPSALALYWCVGAMFLVIQTLIIKRLT